MIFDSLNSSIEPFQKKILELEGVDAENEGGESGNKGVENGSAMTISSD